MSADMMRAPSGLKAAGRRLWREVLESFELRADELRILEAACRQADDVARLDAALKDTPAMLAGSKGQDVLNPVFAEVRQGRLALGRLLTQLGLSEADFVARGESRSTAGRKLARQRWSNRRGA